MKALATGFLCIAGTIAAANTASAADGEPPSVAQLSDAMTSRPVDQTLVLDLVSRMDLTLDNAVGAYNDPQRPDLGLAKDASHDLQALALLYKQAVSIRSAGEQAGSGALQATYGSVDWQSCTYVGRPEDLHPPVDGSLGVGKFTQELQHFSDFYQAAVTSGSMSSEGVQTLIGSSERLKEWNGQIQAMPATFWQVAANCEVAEGGYTLGAKQYETRPIAAGIYDPAHLWLPEDPNGYLTTPLE